MTKLYSSFETKCGLVFNFQFTQEDTHTHTH